MRRYLAASLLFLSLLQPAYSQADLSTAIPNDLVIGCKEALASGQDARPFVEEMLQRAEIPLGSTNAHIAMQCISKVMGEKYRYDDRHFVNDTERNAQQQKAREAEARAKLAAQARKQQAEQRKQAYVMAVVQACIDEYSHDKFRALTTPVCGEVFEVRGLPE